MKTLPIQSEVYISSEVSSLVYGTVRVDLGHIVLVQDISLLFSNQSIAIMTNV